jgi:protein-tyrosine phosphatase
MIDTHIHLLPAVDDGADDLETSRLMALQALAEGVNEMIVTPHFVNDRDYQNHARAQFELLSRTLEQEQINLKISLGNEIHLSEENMAAIFSGLANTMGNSDYLLIELPTNHFYDFHETFLYNLQARGYKIILAHIERYRIFKEQPQKLGKLVEQGIFAQVTSKYLLEGKTRKKGLDWIKSGWIHIIASDAHDLSFRPPLMKAAYKLIEKRFGQCAAIWLFEENPRAILENRLMDPVFISKKRWEIF